MKWRDKTVMICALPALVEATDGECHHEGWTEALPGLTLACFGIWAGLICWLEDINHPHRFKKAGVLALAGSALLVMFLSMLSGVLSLVGISLTGSRCGLVAAWLVISCLTAFVYTVYIDPVNKLDDTAKH